MSSKSYFDFGGGFGEKYHDSRDTPPLVLVEAIKEYQHSKTIKRHLDLGCGTGLFSKLFQDYSEQIIALDISENLLQVARKKNNAENILFRHGTAEELNLFNESVDLITANAAAHWFKKDLFYDEVERVLVPGGVLALSSHFLMFPSPDMGECGEKLNIEFEKLLTNIDGFWPNEYKYTSNKYQNFPAPPNMKDHLRIDHNVELERSLDEWILWLTTWSGFIRFVNHSDDAHDTLINFHEVCKSIINKYHGSSNKNFLLKLRIDWWLLLYRK